MSAAAFLRSLGRVCVRCGLPATGRLGYDLVEPGSGVHVCDSCGLIVRIALLAENERAARLIVRPDWRCRQRMVLARIRRARKLGWHGK